MAGTKEYQRGRHCDSAWDYQDNMDASDAAERCRLKITREANGTLGIASDPQATCQARGGQGTRIGLVTFSADSYESPVTRELDADQDFDAAGTCWRVKAS